MRAARRSNRRRPNRDQTIAGVQSAQAALEAAQASGRRSAGAAAGGHAYRRTSCRLRWRKAERDLSFTEIRAPVDGVIGNRAVQTGDFVQTGQRLASLVPLDDVYVDANFKETQLARLRPGQKVAISVDALPEHAIEGTVASMSPASGAVFSLLPPDNATGNFTKIVQRLPVRIEVPAEVARQRLLRPGMSVVVSVNTKAATMADGAPHIGLISPATRQVALQGARPWLPRTFEAAAAAPDAERIDPRRLLAFLAMCFGMFMAFLDIQIVSASLTEIQAGLAASQDEITWVQTSYLMAEVVAIPLSGFLSRVLGTRMMFAASAAGFTVASLMCGLSSSMSEMIVWRAIQGFVGGGMVPTVFASAYLIFPRSRMPMIVPMIGLVATLAPTIGPTVGGYLTELMSWHWLFFINIVPGIVVTPCDLCAHRFRPAEFRAVREVRLVGADLHGGISRHTRIRARGRSAQRLVRRSDGLRFAP